MTTANTLAGGATPTQEKRNLNSSHSSVTVSASKYKGLVESPPLCDSFGLVIETQCDIDLSDAAFNPSEHNEFVYFLF